MDIVRHLKLAAHHLIRGPLYLIPREAVMRILWGPLAGKRWINGSGIFRFWMGFYEYGKQRRFVEHVKSGSVVFDIGANVGYYTLLGAALAGEGGEVVCFEPDPANLTYLNRHLELNEVRNARVVEAAVSDRDGEVSFRRGEHDASTGRIATDGGLKVRSVTIDSLVGSGSIPPPSLVKIDIEGAEYSALCGAQATLAAHRPTLLLATHGPEVHARCCDFLASNGYTLASLDGRPPEQSEELLCVYHEV